MQICNIKGLCRMYKRKQVVFWPESCIMSKLCSAKLNKNNAKIVTVNLYVYRESDVDVTGVTEVNVNDSCYLLASDSVILKGDDEKYGPDSDDSSSDDHHPSSHAPEAACTFRY